MLNVIGVIPARYHSTRLPQKMLRRIHGKTLIQWVWENAKQATKLDQLIIATDHEEIFQEATQFGAEVVMTREDHPSGTDRIREVVKNMNCDIVINIQGDEPFLGNEAIDHLATIFEEEPALEVATLCFKSEDKKDFADPNVVKIVTDYSGHALYFSRSSIPHYRDQSAAISFLKHFGIYAYRKNFLMNFSKLPDSDLEDTEKLEQLRILENGYKMKVIEMHEDSMGIDTEEDLRQAQELFDAKWNKETTGGTCEK